MLERAFPILGVDRRKYPDLPPTVPWAFVAPHEAQAIKNHSQDLETLASRGGLSWCELLAVLEDRPWRNMNPRQAAETVLALVSVKD